jgi:hypothetical protein
MVTEATLFDPAPRNPARPSIDEVRAAYAADVRHRQGVAKLLERDQTVECPVCTHELHVYAKPLSRQMLDYLVKLARHTDAHGLGYHHARKFLGGSHKASSDGVYLTHWGLIECGGRGLYRITKAGRLWLAGEERIPAGVILWRGTALGWYSARVLPDDVRGRPWDYGATEKPAGELTEDLTP